MNRLDKLFLVFYLGIYFFQFVSLEMVIGGYPIFWPS